MSQTRHFKALELDKILNMCGNFAVSQGAKERILSLVPATNYDHAQNLCQRTKDANDLSVRFGNPAFYQLSPLDEQIGKAKRGGSMSLNELLHAAQTLYATRTLKKWYRTAAEDKTSLEQTFFLLEPNEDLEKEITRCIISEDEIADNASTELSDIRRKIRNANQRARDVLERMIRSSSTQKYLQEQIITIRNGRFVVPVRSEYRNEIKGLVHDTSASGSTLFIEPMTVVELNNSIKELEAAQQNEIHRILVELSSQVAEFGNEFSTNYDVIVELDTVFAKSKLGDSMKAVPPQLIKEGETNLRQARHPLIPDEDIVPIDINVGGEFDTLVVTGPNTGGKTVALKTIGLLTLMASCGLMIPAASRSEICFYPQVLADIGDEQSIEQSLSTFSGHMTNIASILKTADQNSLVLIDELGAGTDPTEGAALAVAIISKLREHGAKIVATTHYAEVKIYALQTQGVENASCEFDVATLRPTYRLLIGTPGRSNAFAISERLGISHDIIVHAGELVSSENKRFEDVVSSLEDTRHGLEQERLQAQSLRQQAAATKESAESQSKELKESQEKILEHARSQARSLLERVRFQSDLIMEELADLQKQKITRNFGESLSAAQSRIRRMVDELEEEANPVIKRDRDFTPPKNLKRGDTVFLMDFNAEGTVLSPADSAGNIRVQAGIIETKVPVTSIRLLDKPKAKVTMNGGAVRTTRAKKSSSSGTSTGKLDLRGLDSQEAALEVDQFIDRSVLSGLGMITIVHGKGTGVLRDMVGQKLYRHPQIENYRLGEYGEGGDGVTIAELK